MTINSDLLYELAARGVPKETALEISRLPRFGSVAPEPEKIASEPPTTTHEITASRYLNTDLERFVTVAHKYRDGTSATVTEVCSAAGIELPFAGKLYSRRLQQLGWIDTGLKRRGCHVYQKQQQITG